jgi:predicted metallo-beta-lactamase superfamily hydrolase
VIDQSYTEATFSGISRNALMGFTLEVRLAVEFLDVEPSLLEARRKELFGKAENRDGI